MSRPPTDVSNLKHLRVQKVERVNKKNNIKKNTGTSSRSIEKAVSRGSWAYFQKIHIIQTVLMVLESDVKF